jgi:amylosucrase
MEAAVYEKNDWKLQAALDLDITLHAFLFTQSGIPVLYSGDEIGQLNDYGYHDDPLKREDSRYLHRGDFEWNLAEMRHDPETRQGMMFARLKQLIDIRKQYDVFDGNADVWVVETWNPHILGIGRYYSGQKLIGLFNFSEIEQTAWIHENEYYTDLLDGNPVNSDHVTLPGHGFVWMYHSYEPQREVLKKAKAVSLAAIREEIEETVAEAVVEAEAAIEKEAEAIVEKETKAKKAVKAKKNTKAKKTAKEGKE